MQAADYYTLPTLIYLMCVMSSMSFIVSGNVFLFRVLQGREDNIDGLGRTVLIGQVLSFLSVALFSFCISFYDFLVNGGALSVYGELLILSVGLVVCALKASDKGSFFGIVCGLKSFFYFLCMCFAGWVMTIGVGISVSRILEFIYVHFGLFPGRIVFVFFISGFLWNVPTLVIYRMIRKRYGEGDVLQDVRFHRVLWPVLMAYMVLLFPLMIERNVNSPEWKERQHARPLRST